MVGVRLLFSTHPGNQEQDGVKNLIYHHRQHSREIPGGTATISKLEPMSDDYEQGRMLNSGIQPPPPWLYILFAAFELHDVVLACWRLGHEIEDGLKVLW